MHTASPEQIYTDSYNNWMLIRRIQLSIGCLALAFIIGNIIFRRLYIYNTSKLFMFCCIAELIGMAAVLPHNGSVTSGHTYAYLDKQNSPNMLDVLNDMKKQNKLIWCGLSAFVNLFAYDIGYFFAVLITYNVSCVLNDSYRNFMRKILGNRYIWGFFAFMLLAYLTPLILTFVYSDFNSDSYIFSYGPSGFTKIDDEIQPKQSALLLLYCGTCTNPRHGWALILPLFCTYICPIVMLIIHSLMLLKNNKKIKKFQNEQFLNSKQQFLLKSGKISLIVFIIQAINFVKLILTMVLPIESVFVEYLIIFLNFIFDLYPFVLLLFFYAYTKQFKGPKFGSSTVLEETD